MSSNYDLGTVKDLSTLIADKLVELILDGELEPGRRLVQNDLASRFGVSRVAIRDALMKLRHRGLSVNLPLRGEIVRPVTRKSVSEVFAVRRLLESEAVREAVPRMDAAAHAESRRRAERQAERAEAGDLAGAITADWEFHESIYRYCDNGELRSIIEELWRRIRQARSVARRDAEWGGRWARRSVDRHSHLLRAIELRDADAAARITTANIEESASELQSKLAQLGWE
jgi:DNA-binding GntR family transcriptional regulator